MLRKSSVRTMAAAVVAIAGVVGAPAVASAEPTDVADTGSAIIDLGSAVADLGSSILGLPGPSGSFGGGGGGGGGGPAAPEQTLPCNASAQSGHDGVTVTRHELGRSGPLSFQLTYNTYSVPDRITVFYQGQRVAGTGWVGDENYVGNGQGSLGVSVPPGVDTFVDVQVEGGNQTDWDYTVNCP